MERLQSDLGMAQRAIRKRDDTIESLKRLVEVSGALVLVSLLSLRTRPTTLLLALVASASSCRYAVRERGAH